jgi:hypothetical protein
MSFFGLFSGGSSGDDVTIKIGANTEGAEGKVKQLDTSLSSLGGSAVKAGAVIGTAFVAGVAGLTKLGVSLASAGENLGSLEAGFTALGGSFSTIEEASSRTLGLVSNVDLLSVANKAMVSGLPDVNKNFGDIADLGARLANTLGTDVKGSIEGLTNALARGRTTQLAQYGLFVDSAKAAEEYARKNGLVSSSLTETQKRAAIQEAALAQVRDRLGEVAAVSDSLTNALTAANNKWSDKLANVGKLINENPKLIDGVRQFSENLDQIDLNVFAQIAADAAGLALQIANSVLPSMNSLGVGFQVLMDITKQWGVLFYDILKGIVQGFTGAIGAINKGMLTLIPGAKIVSEALGFQTSGVENLTDAYNTFANITLPSVATANMNVSVKLNEFRRQIVETGDKSAESGKKIKQGLLDPLSESPRSIDKATKSITEFTDVQRWLRTELDRARFGKQFDEIADALNNKVISIGDAIDHIEMLKREMKEAGIEAELFNSLIGKIDLQSAFKMPDSEGKGGFMDRLFSAEFAQMAMGGDAASMLLGADPITALLANLGKAVGQLGQILFREVSKAIGLERGGLGDEIGGVIGGIFGELGSSVGGFIGAFADKLFGGSTNEQTARRRQVEGFIDEIFKTWDFMARDYQGRMVRFDDLVLGSRHDFNPGSAFLESLEEFEPEIRMFFRGLGGALGVEFGDDFAAGASIGEKLMVAFGGDIDSLQLLLLETGMTFEQAMDNMQRAFLRGQVSASEYVAVLDTIAPAFEDGLVGFGRFEDAMQNFIDSGGRGRAALKSFKDMFVEWLEANPNGTLEEFRQALIASGRFAVEDIDMFFNAIYERGITSMQDLMSASDDFIIRLIGSLESSGFGFADSLDATSERLDQIEGKLDRIGQGRTVNIQLRVSSRFDSRETENAWNQEFGGRGIGLRNEG